MSEMQILRSSSGLDLRTVPTDHTQGIAGDNTLDLTQTRHVEVKKVFNFQIKCTGTW